MTLSPAVAHHLLGRALLPLPNMDREHLLRRLVPEISREIPGCNDIYCLVTQLILAADLIFPMYTPILDLMPAAIQSYRDSKKRQDNDLSQRRSRREKKLLFDERKRKHGLRHNPEIYKPRTPGRVRLLPECGLLQRAFYDRLRVEEIRQEEALFESVPTPPHFEIEEFETVLLNRYLKEIITQYLHCKLALAIAGQGTYIYRFDETCYGTTLLKSGMIREPMEPGREKKQFNQYGDTLYEKLTERFTFNGQCLLTPRATSVTANDSAADIKHRFESLRCTPEKREMVKSALETLNLHLE